MDYQKRKENKPKFRGTKSPGRRDNRDHANIEGTIDASPGEPPESLASRSAPQQQSDPRSIRDTKAWQDSSGGAKRLWHNYRTMLITHFQRMPRSEQETLITRISQIITIGSSVLIIQFFYYFVPDIFRVFLLPALLAAAYFAGTKIVAPLMIDRFEQHLNQEF